MPNRLCKIFVIVIVVFPLSYCASRASFPKREIPKDYEIFKPSFRELDYYTTKKLPPLNRLPISIEFSEKRDGRLDQLANLIGEFLKVKGRFSPLLIYPLRIWLGIPESRLEIQLISANDLSTLKERIFSYISSTGGTRFGILIERRDRFSFVGIIVVSYISINFETNIPKYISDNRRLLLKGRVEGSFKKPKLIISYPRGDIKEMELSRGYTFNMELPLITNGKYSIEIVGEGVYGDSVLANFTVYKGELPPQEILYHKFETQKFIEEDFTRELFKLINNTRKELKLHPLIWDERLSKIAQAHSIDMVKNNFIGHISPTTGGPLERLIGMGVRPLKVGENVGIGYSPTEIHLSFMESPGHKINIISEEFSHIGIGIYPKDNTSFVVTELFTLFPEKIDSKRAHYMILSRINRLRKDKGLAPAFEEDLLNSVALEGAKDFFDRIEIKQDELLYLINKRLEKYGAIYSKVGTIIEVVDDINRAGAVPQLIEFDYDFIGIGVMQGDHPRYGTNIIIVVYVVAWKR